MKHSVSDLSHVTRELRWFRLIETWSPFRIWTALADKDALLQDRDVS